MQKQSSRGLVFAIALLLPGCGSGSGTQRAFTPAQEAEMKQKETSGERKILEDLEAKYGPDHPQVIQMKMELGITKFPEVPAGK